MLWAKALGMPILTAPSASASANRYTCREEPHASERKSSFIKTHNMAGAVTVIMSLSAVFFLFKFIKGELLQIYIHTNMVLSKLHSEFVVS